MRYSEFFKLMENKNRFIDANTHLTDEQKIAIKAFFQKHPNYENRLDWNKFRDLTYDDFAPVLALEGKGSNQARKKGVEGLIEGKDYILIDRDETSDGSPYVVYQPLNYYAARILASNKVLPKVPQRYEDEGISGAKWCIAYQQDRDYWDSHLLDSKEVFLFICGENIPTKKVAVSISTEEYDADDQRHLHSLKEGDLVLYFNIWDAYDSCVTIRPSYLPIRNLKELIIAAYKNLPIIMDQHEEDVERTARVGKEKLFQDLKLNPETQRYDCDKDLGYEDLRWVFKDGELTIPFGVVKGDFSFYKLNPASLKNCPIEVGGSFNIQGQPYIRNLVGAPRKIGRWLQASGCQLESLEGMPQEVSYVDISSTPIKSLKGLPSQVVHLDCSFTEITSLEGSPKTVEASFFCCNTEITSLKGGPLLVGETFDCSNTEIQSLIGGPRLVGDTYSVEGCGDLTSFFGISQTANTIYAGNSGIESLAYLPKDVLYVDVSGCFVDDFDTLPEGIPEKNIAGVRRQ